MSKHHILLYLKHTVLFRVPFLSAKQQMLEDKRLYSSQHSTGSTLYYNPITLFYKAKILQGEL